MKEGRNMNCNRGLFLANILLPSNGVETFVATNRQTATNNLPKITLCCDAWDGRSTTSWFSSAFLCLSLLCSLELPDYPHNGANLWAVAVDTASGDALLSLQTLRVQLGEQHIRDQFPTKWFCPSTFWKYTPLSTMKCNGRGALQF